MSVYRTIGPTLVFCFQCQFIFYIFIVFLYSDLTKAAGVISNTVQFIYRSVVLYRNKKDKLNIKKVV